MSVVLFCLWVVIIIQNVCVHVCVLTWSSLFSCLKQQTGQWWPAAAVAAQSIPHCHLWVSEWTAALTGRRKKPNIRLPLHKWSINHQCEWLPYNKQAEMMHGVSAGASHRGGQRQLDLPRWFTCDLHRCTSSVLPTDREGVKEMGRKRDMERLPFYASSNPLPASKQVRAHTHTHVQ